MKKAILYRGFKIEKSGFNYYVTNPGGHRAFCATPTSVSMAKRWIDVELACKS